MTTSEINIKTNERPFGISFISVISILKGIIGLIVLVFASIFSDQENFNFDIGFEYAERLVYLVVGIGLSLGKRWAWWIIVFLLAFSVFYSLFSVVISKQLLLEMGASASEISKYFYKLGATIIFQLILLLYLFQKNVFKFFDFKSSSLSKKLTIVFGINSLLIILVIVRELYT